MVAKGERVVRDKLGIWDEQIHTTVCKIDNHQGPAAPGPLSLYIHRGPSIVCVCVCVCVYVLTCALN